MSSFSEHKEFSKDLFNPEDKNSSARAFDTDKDIHIILILFTNRSSGILDMLHLNGYNSKPTVINLFMTDQEYNKKLRAISKELSDFGKKN